MKRIAVYIFAAFSATAVAVPTAGAQSTTAQISGAIKDQSGAVLPGVEVTVTQTATGAKRTAVEEHRIQPVQHFYASSGFGVGSERRWQNVGAGFGRNLHRPRRFVFDECDGAGCAVRKRDHGE